MIKIIEQGQQTFTRTCDRCGCKFQYDLSDLGGLDYINCPFCHTTLTHIGPKTVKMNLIKDNKTVGDAGYNFGTTTGQYVNPNTATTISDGTITVGDPNTTIYSNKLPDDLINDQYNNVGIQLPDDVQDNCCYESDLYKAWYEKWCKKVREKEPVWCNK